MTRRSYMLADQLQVPILISLKMIMDSAKNCRWIIPFKKFGMIRVKYIPLFTQFRIMVMSWLK